mmetsp:Transcript_5621/g.34852  ORF Transcript_5621/g.34852 Transcript_5621/m.34852 type:complete len:326 (+) Transcript_5621:2498-3475(+)
MDSRCHHQQQACFPCFESSIGNSPTHSHSQEECRQDHGYKDGNPCQHGNGHSTEQGCGHKGHEGIAVEAEQGGQFHPGIPDPQSDIHGQWHHDGVSVEEQCCKGDLCHIVLPFSTAFIGFDPIGKVPSCSCSKHQCCTGPERSVKVWFFAEVFPRGTHLRSGDGRRAPGHHFFGVHVEQRLVFGVREPRVGVSTLGCTSRFVRFCRWHETKPRGGRPCFSHGSVAVYLRIFHRRYERRWRERCTVGHRQCRFSTFVVFGTALFVRRIFSEIHQCRRRERIVVLVSTAMQQVIFRHPCDVSHVSSARLNTLESTVSRSPFMHVLYS